MIYLYTNTTQPARPVSRSTASNNASFHKRSTQCRKAREQTHWRRRMRRRRKKNAFCHLIVFGESVGIKTGFFRRMCVFILAEIYECRSSRYTPRLPAMRNACRIWRKKIQQWQKDDEPTTTASRILLYEAFRQQRRKWFLPKNEYIYIFFRRMEDEAHIARTDEKFYEINSGQRCTAYTFLFDVASHIISFGFVLELWIKRKYTHSASLT